MNYKILSLYWNNIDPSIPKNQKEVFEHLGFSVEQHKKDGMKHGLWMDDEVRKLNDYEIIIFCDIDAFPLNRKAVLDAIEIAENGKIFGLAQVANHINPSQVYAGPMFVAFSKSTWLKCGSPSLLESSTQDVGQSLTIAAQKNNIPVEIKYPTACIKPMWPLSSFGVFGIGTFFELDFFHLFESRNDSNIKLFNRVAKDVLQSSHLCFDDYLNIARV